MENEIAISLGFPEKANNSVYIAQVMIGTDGEIKFHRRKMKPTHMKRTIFGDASRECFSSVADLSFARVGSLSCWEHIQPLLKYHTLSQHGQPHQHTQGGGKTYGLGQQKFRLSRPPSNVLLIFATGCESLSQTYAIELQSFFLHCTAMLGEEDIEKMKMSGVAPMSSPGGGSSAIFGPDGRRLTEPVESNTERIIYGDLPLDPILATKLFVNSTGHYSRPDLTHYQS